MYKIFFGNRYLAILPLKNSKSEQSNFLFFECKNKKSFDNAYLKFQKDGSRDNLNILSTNPDKLFMHFTKKFKIVKAAGGLIENSEGKILIMKRDGVWDLPKGKIEKGEKKKSAAVREVEEECGIHNLVIKRKIGKTYHTFSQNGLMVLKITHWYRMLYGGSELPVPETREGISEIIWVENEQLANIIEVTYPNLRAVMESALTN